MTDHTTDILPFRSHETTLPNQLRVIVVPTGYPNLVSLQIPVQTGSRNEVEPGKSGFAHFFEHMMFRGTDRIPAEKYKDIIGETGARQNAYTTDDYTNFHVTLAKEDLELLLDIEADRFMNLKYAEEDFRTEARAVLGEYNKNSANPLQKLFEVQRDAAFTTHTYKHTTMGFLRDIEAMPEQFDYSLQFFDRWYRPEYTTVLVAGDVEPEQTIALVEKYWGAWKPGGYRVEVPQEPPPTGPVTVHVPWESPTLPFVTVTFRGPALSETDTDYAAIDMLLDLQFGATSELYRRLVEVERKVDVLRPFNPPHADPSLMTVLARLRDPADAAYVRDQILATLADCVREPLPAARLEEAKSYARYGFVRTLDNSESIAETLAMFVRFRRSYDTLNKLYRQYEALSPDDVLAPARRYIRDANLVLTTLSQEQLPEAATAAPVLPEPPDAAETTDAPLVIQRSVSPLLRMKLQFDAGSAHDPSGKEGLAVMAAEMVADAGSAEMRIDEIKRALFPMAGSFHAQVDREMTTFTGVIHRDNLDRYADIVLPQLLAPGLRDDDFERIKQQQLNALVQDLRANNDEELGKERLQTNVFAGSPYGHTTLGTVAGIESIAVDDLRDFIATAYTHANLTIGLAGDVPETFIGRLQGELRGLPAGDPLPAPVVSARTLQGIEVEIIEKDTRATAISFGHPIAVTRAHPDYVPLYVARSWLGEHRAFHSRLFQRIREIRGLNYGDYAYIEAFPHGMYEFFPDPNVARRAQIFEGWIRPVQPEHAVFALKIALHEIDQLIEHGMSEQDFEATRNYLMKNVFLMTKTQDQQLGYALDSRWYGIGEYTSMMRERLASLDAAAVNEAVRRHLSAKDLLVVAITKDAAGLRDQLLSEEPTSITYEAPKPQDVLGEDKVIGARKLNIRPDAVRITPVDEVFAR